MINEFRGKYRFLSNFHPCNMEYEGIKYPSSEHAFQAAKTDKYDIRSIISELKTPAEAKQFGREIRLQRDWNNIRIGIMKNILRIKFSQRGFRDSLLRTGEEELIEGNTWGDKFWGVCNGEGSNHLGKLLMEIREEIRKEIADGTHNAH